jgi:hypothetical protein
MQKKIMVLLCSLLVTTLLSGFASAGLDTWDVTIDEITFKSGRSSFIQSAELTNGNVVIAYKDPDDQRGKFVIYNSDGIEILGETTFSWESVDDVSVTGLNNGNFLIAYEKNSTTTTCNFVIFNASGHQIGGETFIKNGNTAWIRLATLTNGNVIILYRDYPDMDGKFVIYDTNEDLIGSETVYYAGSVGSVSVTSLLNGNALIAYWDGPGDAGAFVISDTNGYIVKSATVFSSEKIGGPHATTLANGNVFISYGKGPYPYTGHFVILDVDGNTVRSEMDLNLSGSVDEITSTVLSNDDILLAYRRGEGSDNSGNFIILDPDGNLSRERTIFYDGVINNNSPLTLSNGNVMVPFGEGGTPRFSKFAYIFNPVLNPSDLDGDGDVDGEDLSILVQGLSTTYDLEDIQGFAQQFGE